MACGVCMGINSDQCPVCGKKIMLCSMCGHHNDCDWTEEAGCKMKKEEYHE